MEPVHELADRVARCLARHADHAIQPAVLVACSGGVDSTALALAVAELQRAGRLRGSAVLAHIDHGIHERAASAAAAVEALARRLGFGFGLRRLSLPPDERGEAQLRHARYAALVALAREHVAGCVLTAHHADDNLETLLFRIARGTGPRGLAGIPEYRSLAPGLALLRPFLQVRRATLEQVVAAAGVSVVEDPTNAELRIARNAIRARTLPALRDELGPGLEVTLFALLRAARATTEALETQARAELTACGRLVTPWRLEVDLPRGALPPAPVREEMVRQLPALLGLPAPSWRWVERVHALLGAAHGSRVLGRQPRSGAHLLVERTRRGLLAVDLARCGAAPAGRQDLELDRAPLPFGTTEWSLQARTLAEAPLEPRPDEAGPLRALLDAGTLAFPLGLRTRAAEDLFWPLGMAGPVHLRRFLQSRPVPRFDRDRMPLVVDATDRVVWVPGVALGHTARVRPGTARCVELRADLGAAT